MEQLRFPRPPQPAERRRRLSHLCTLLCLLAAGLSLPPASAEAQSSAAALLNGTLAALDTEQAIITVKSRSGVETRLRLTEKTRLFHDKKPCDTTAFKIGEEITARYRRSAVGPGTLIDLVDKPTWAWLDRVRHQTTRVVIGEIEDGWLRGTEGDDKAPVEFRITEKTAWSKAGRAASPEDFRPGDTVFIAPQMLATGAIKAVAVSEAPGTTAVLKERTKRTVSGKVTSVDASARSIKLHTAAGDDRALPVAGTAAVRLGGRDGAFSSIKVGQQVTAHIERVEETETVVRITVQSGTARKPAPRKPPTKGGSAMRKP